MSKQYGYAGNILHINLTTGEIRKILSNKYLPESIGGRALAARLYWDFVPADCEPFDPENCLIMTAGALTGTGAALSGIGICVGKSSSVSPKHTYFVSQCACDWSHEMKYAGYDAIITTGSSPKPVYINVFNDNVEILDAANLDLWGTTTRECRNRLVDKYGRNTLVACIGPAGENKVVQAVINTDCNSAFSQGGYAAVMGSKNLKAIAINGTGSIEVADPERILGLNEINRKLNSIKDGEVREYNGKTTVGHLDPTLSIFYPNPESGLNTEVKEGTCHIRKAGCPGCNRMCKTKVHFDDGSIPDGAWDCGETVFNLTTTQAYYGGRPYGRPNRALSMYNDELGIDCFSNGVSGFSIFDTGSTKMTVDYSKKGRGAASAVMDIWLAAVQDGTLTNENTGVDWSKFGSIEFMKTWLDNLAYRIGFGDILANGLEYACNYIAGHEEYGPKREKVRHYYERTCVKAGVFGGINRHCLMLGYGATTVKPLPSATLYSAVNVKRGREPHAIMGHPGRGVTAPPADFSLHFYGTDNFEGDNWGRDLARAVATHELYSIESDSIPYCSHNTWIIPSENFFDWNDPIEYTKYSLMCCAEYVTAVHGKTYTREDILKMDEAAINLERAIWLRDGYLEGPVDTFWDCIFEEEDMEGNLLIPRDKFEQCLQYYYEARGWVNGIPTRHKLEELGMRDVADALEQKYNIPLEA